MKVLVDQMYDGLEANLRDMGYDAYSVRKISGKEPKMGSDYFAVHYAKENGMVVVTADAGMGKDCAAAGVPCILMDKEKILPVIKRELDVYGSSRQD